MTPKFWRNKKVLITGHTGFKGSWLTMWLKSQGAQVTGLSLAPPSTPNLFEVAKVAKGITSFEGNIRETKTVENALQKSGGEIIIHMAAQSLVGEGYVSPLSTFGTNIMGTAQVLEAARKMSGVKAILIVTSDKCYENYEGLKPYNENQRLGGNDPYSSSKACAELVAKSYRKSFFENRVVATARSGNVIGGGDWAKDRLVPDLIRALTKKEVARIRNPDSVRPWQHVLDPLNGYLILCERLYGRQDLKFAEAWNFGPTRNSAVTVAKLCDDVVSKWGGGEWAASPLDDSRRESFHLTLDSAKAQEGLEWVPKLALDTTLDWAVDWYKAYLNGEKMDTFTLKQIEKFESL